VGPAAARIRRTRFRRSADAGDPASADSENGLDGGVRVLPYHAHAVDEIDGLVELLLLDQTRDNPVDRLLPDVVPGSNRLNLFDHLDGVFQIDLRRGRHYQNLHPLALRIVRRRNPERNRERPLHRLTSLLSVQALIVLADPHQRRRAHFRLSPRSHVESRLQQLTGFLVRCRFSWLILRKRRQT